MNVDLIFKIAAIGILVSVLNQVLTRSGRDEQATMTTLAGLVVVLMMVVQEISDLFNLVKNLFGLKSMPDMVKIAAIAVAAALCAVVVKKNVAELGMVLALCAGAIILSCSLGALEGVKELMDTLADTAGLSPAVLAPVVKTVGIAVLTRVSAELCRDAKEGGIAAFVETAGAAAALLVSLPLLKTVLSMVTGLL